MTLDIQSVIRAADPAPSVPAYDDAAAAALLQRAIDSTPPAPTACGTWSPASSPAAGRAA